MTLQKTKSRQTIIVVPELRSALNELSECLDNILGWARDPDPNPLTDDWWNKIKIAISGAVEFASETAVAAALNSEMFHRESPFTGSIAIARKLAIRYVGMMHRHPDISTIPRQQWTVSAYCRLFDDLDEFARKFANPERFMWDDLPIESSGEKNLADNHKKARTKKGANSELENALLKMRLQGEKNGKELKDIHASFLKKYRPQMAKRAAEFELQWKTITRVVRRQIKEISKTK